MQYDLALNGWELGGGSVRIHRRDLLERSFALQGHRREGMREKFGGILEAFEYGAPPHGGIALGIDRWAMILGRQTNIREVMAFPKTSSGHGPHARCAIGARARAVRRARPALRGLPGEGLIPRVSAAGERGPACAAGGPRRAARDRAAPAGRCRSSAQRRGQRRHLHLVLGNHLQAVRGRPYDGILLAERDRHGAPLDPGRVEDGRFGRRTRREREWAIVAGLFFAADLECFHYGVTLVGAGLGTVLPNLQVVVVALATWLLFGERPPARAIAAIPLVLVGVLLISGILDDAAYGANPVAGAVLGAAAASSRGLPGDHAAGQPRPATRRRAAGRRDLTTAVAVVPVGLLLGSLDLTPSLVQLAWMALLALTSQVLG